MESIKKFFKSTKGILSIVLTAVMMVVGFLFMSQSSSSGTTNRTKNAKHNNEDLQDLLKKATKDTNENNQKIEQNNARVSDINDDIENIPTSNESSDGIETLKKAGHNVTPNSD